MLVTNVVELELLKVMFLLIFVTRSGLKNVVQVLLVSHMETLRFWQCFYIYKTKSRRNIALLFQHNARLFCSKLCRHNVDSPNNKSK